MSCAPKFRCNVDVLLQYLVEKVPLPVRYVERRERRERGRVGEWDGNTVAHNIITET